MNRHDLCSYVTGIYTVKYADESSPTVHQERHVNLPMKTCTCLKFQDMRLPCVHAMAAAISENTRKTNIEIVHTWCHDSYHVAKENILDGIAFDNVAPQSDDALRAIAKASPSVSRFLAQASACGQSTSDDGSGETVVKAPPPRTDHGARKHKRKSANPHIGRGSTGSNTRSRTGSQSYAVTTAEKRQAQHTCKACKNAGRRAPEYNVTNHVAKTCPHELSIPAVIIIDSDDEPLA